MGILEISSVCPQQLSSCFAYLPFPLDWALWRTSLCTVILGLFWVMCELFILCVLSFESYCVFPFSSLPSSPFSSCLCFLFLSPSSLPPSLSSSSFCAGIRVYLKASHMLGKWSTTELYPQAPRVLHFCYFINTSNKNVNNLKYKTDF